jgi:hypothetical protein
MSSIYISGSKDDGYYIFSYYKGEKYEIKEIGFSTLIDTLSFILYTFDNDITEIDDIISSYDNWYNQYYDEEDETPLKILSLQQIINNYKLKPIIIDNYFTLEYNNDFAILFSKITHKVYQILLKTGNEISFSELYDENQILKEQLNRYKELYNNAIEFRPDTVKVSNIIHTLESSTLDKKI